MSARDRVSFWILVALGIAAGITLRLYRIDEQILLDDEWHSLLQQGEHGYSWLASHFGESDHCIPLTLWHKVLGCWVGLDEVLVRLVPLAAGVATLWCSHSRSAPRPEP